MPRCEMKAEADEYKLKGIMLILQTVPATAHLEDRVHICLRCCKEKVKRIIALTNIAVQRRSES